MLQGVKQMGLQVGTLLPDQYGGNASRQALQAQAVKMAQDDAAYQPLRDMRPWATGIGEAAPLLFAAPVLGTSVARIAASPALPGLIEYGSAGTSCQCIHRRGWRGGGRACRQGDWQGDAAVPGTPTPDIKPGWMRHRRSATTCLWASVSTARGANGRAATGEESNLGARRTGAQRCQSAGHQPRCRKGDWRNATHLTDDVLAAAKARIGAKFDDIAGRNIVNVGGDQPMDALVNVDMQQRALGKFAQPRVTALVDKGLDLAAKGSVSGKPTRRFAPSSKQAQSGVHWRQ